MMASRGAYIEAALTNMLTIPSKRNNLLEEKQ